MSNEVLVIGAIHESSGAIGINGNQLDNSTPTAGAAYILALDNDNDGIFNSIDACPNNASSLDVNNVGRPLSDLNNDCKVNGLDVPTYVNDPSVRPIEEFVADLLI